MPSIPGPDDDRVDDAGVDGGGGHEDERKCVPHPRCSRAGVLGQLTHTKLAAQPRIAGDKHSR